MDMCICYKTTKTSLGMMNNKFINSDYLWRGKKRSRIGEGYTGSFSCIFSVLFFRIYFLETDTAKC